MQVLTHRKKAALVEATSSLLEGVGGCELASDQEKNKQ